MNGGVGKEGRVEWKGREVGKQTRRGGVEKVRGKRREEEGRKGEKVKEGKKRNALEQ